MKQITVTIHPDATLLTVRIKHDDNSETRSHLTVSELSHVVVNNDLTHDISAMEFNCTNGESTYVYK